MKKYRIFFNQVNQEHYDVTAKNEDNAIKRAVKEWRECNSYPSINSIEEMDRKNGMVTNEQ